MKLHEHTLALLTVKRDGAPSASCKIEIGEYVPLRAYTHDEPIGAGYVRLGNYSTTLIELMVEPRIQVLCGVTITSIDELSLWPEFAVVHTLKGLPVLSTTFESYEVVDLRDDFKVATRRGEVIVFWADLTQSTGYQCGRMCVLTVDGVMVGVWFTGLTEQETDVFLSHAAGT